MDPLSAENKLIFCTGPITDTRIYGSCRHGVFTSRSYWNLFRILLRSRVAEPMSRTGYDAFYHRGGVLGTRLDRSLRSERDLHSAADLWGKETYVTEDEVLKRVNQKGAGALSSVLRVKIESICCH